MDLVLTKMQTTNSNQELIGEGSAVDVSRFDGQSVEVVLPTSLGTGTLVNLRFVLKSKSNLTLEAVAKVTECDPVNPGNFRLHLQLRQFDNQNWQQILKALGARQDHADQIFSKIKGES